MADPTRDREALNEIAHVANALNPLDPPNREEYIAELRERLWAGLAVLAPGVESWPIRASRTLDARGGTMPDPKAVDPEEWSRLYPEGTAMQYQPVWGEDEPWERVYVRSRAWRLGDGSTVAKVTGRAGGVLVTHLRPAPEGVRAALASDGAQEPDGRRVEGYAVPIDDPTARYFHRESDPDEIPDWGVPATLTLHPLPEQTDE